MGHEMSHEMSHVKYAHTSMTLYMMTNKVHMISTTLQATTLCKS